MGGRQLKAAGQRVNVAVIGLGVGRWHADEYAASSIANLVAVCDVDGKRLAEAQERYGLDRAYTSYEELCADDGVDAVSVSVPNALHAQISIHALEHGKHVLCEKPLADSVANGRAMVQAAQVSGRVAMVAMKFRFTNEAVHIRRLLDEGRLGDVYYGWTTYLRPVGGIPAIGSWFTRKEISGGGTMIDNGVHFLDVLWWLMGCPTPTRVSGATYAKFGPEGRGPRPTDRRPSPGEFSVEDLATAMIHFENGASVLMDNGWAGFVEDQTMSVRLMGTQGGATMWPFCVTAEAQDESVMDDTPTLPEEPQQTQFDAFAQCVLKGEQPISSFENCFTVLQMLHAVYRSAECGAEVTV